jgi:hypothetical protein
MDLKRAAIQARDFGETKMRNQREGKPERSVAAATSIKSDLPMAFRLKHA